MKSNKLAEIANDNELGNVSSHLWEACMRKTKHDNKQNTLAIEKYIKIMKLILKELNK